MFEIKQAKQFIERLRRSSYYLTITRLNLSKCDLANISLLEMPQLQQVNLYQNKIQSLASFRNCHRLTDLNLGNNQIRSLIELLYLKDAKSLTSLCLENNPCSEEGGMNCRIAVLHQLPPEYSDRNPEQQSLERETDGQSEVPENFFPGHIEPPQEPWYDNGNGQEDGDAAAWIYPGNAEGFRDPEYPEQRSLEQETDGQSVANLLPIEVASSLLYDSEEGIRYSSPRLPVEVPENTFPRHIEPAQEPWYMNDNGARNRTIAFSTTSTASDTRYPERQEDSDAAAWICPYNAEGFRDPEYRPSGREVFENSFPRHIEPAQEPWYMNGNGNGLTTARNRTIYPYNAEGFSDPEYRPSGRQVPENSFPRHIEPAQDPWYNNCNGQEDSDAAGWTYPNNGYDPFRDQEYHPSGRDSRRSIHSGSYEGTGSVRRQPQERLRYSSPRQPELVPENSSWSGRSTARTRGVTPRHSERQQVRVIYPDNAEEVHDLEQQRREHNVNLLSGTMDLIREMDAFTLEVLCHLIEDHLRYR